MVAYSKDAIAAAKKNGLHLVKIELNGNHAKRGTMSLAVTCGPEMAAKIAELFTLLCSVEKRAK